MKLACLDLTDEFFDALHHYNSYLALALNIEKHVTGKRYSIDEDVLFLAHNHTPEDIKLAGKIQALRNEVEHCSIPMIFVSENLSSELSDLYHDEEFVWTSALPFDSGKFFELLTTVTEFKKINQSLLKMRRDLQRAITAKEYKKASEMITLIEADYPNPFKIMILKGDMYLALKKPDLAEQCFIKALAIRPTSFAANSQLAKVYHLQGKMTKFQETLEKTSKFAEVYVKNLIHWGNIYLERGDGNKSVTAFERALEKDETNVEAQEGMLASSLMSGKIEMAQKVMRESPHSFELARLCNLKGISMANAGHFQSAEKLYKNAIQFLPDEAAVHKLWFNLGLCLKKKGDLNKALHFFERAQKIAPPGYTKVWQHIQQIKKELEIKAKAKAQ